MYWQDVEAAEEGRAMPGLFRFSALSFSIIRRIVRGQKP